MGKRALSAGYHSDVTQKPPQSNSKQTPWSQNKTLLNLLTTLCVCLLLYLTGAGTAKPRRHRSLSSKMQPTLELPQHFSHPRYATHCLQLHGDGFQFQPRDTLTSVKSTEPTCLSYPPTNSGSPSPSSDSESKHTGSRLLWHPGREREIQVGVRPGDCFWHIGDKTWTFL